MAINGLLHTFAYLNGPMWGTCKGQIFSAFSLDRTNWPCYDDLHVIGGTRVKIMWAGGDESGMDVWII